MLGMQKMYKLSRCLLIIALVINLTACASLQKRDVYQVLHSTGVAYSVLMHSVADLYTKGLISEAQWKEIRRLAIAYYVAYQTAVDAMEISLRLETVEAKKQFEQAVRLAVSKFDELRAYITALREGIGK